MPIWPKKAPAGACLGKGSFFAEKKPCGSLLREGELFLPKKKPCGSLLREGELIKGPYMGPWAPHMGPIVYFLYIAYIFPADFQYIFLYISYIYFPS